MADPTVCIVLAHGEPRREWCDGCLTSARLVVGVYALGGDGPDQIGTFAGCTRCEADLFADG